MFDREDVVFRDALDRIYHRLLYGDGSSDQIAGYYGALKGSQTMEAHFRAVGRIEGIELCIEEMRELAHSMNKEDNESPRYDRSMN